MRILSLSLVYPNPAEPGLGPFVRARLQHLAAHAEVKVLAPVPLLDYSNPRGRILRRRTIAPVRQDGPIEVLHPSWLFPPLGTPLNAACLFARLAPLVYRLRKRFPFDVIDAHFGYPEGVAAALLAKGFRVPFTITLRGNEPVFAETAWRRPAIAWALRHAAAAIAVSGELRRFAVAAGAVPEMARTIPNGIDAAMFYPRPPADTRGAKIVLTAGELIEAKGHHLIIEAMGRLCRQGMDARLLIAGRAARGGPAYERQLRGLVSAMHLEDRVFFLGWVPPERLAELLSTASLFCLASYTEGWPNVVHEAMACGTPVVATRVGAVPDMIPSSRFGFIVPPHDAGALAGALRRGLECKWDREAIASHGRSRRWEQVASEVRAVMEEVLRRGANAVPCGPKPVYVRH